MGFVGGGGNIAIATALGVWCPLLSCILFEIITPFMGFHLHLFFYACLRLRFPDVETTQLKILSISSVADGRMKQKSDFSVGFLTRRLATNKTSCIVRGLQYTIMCDFRSAITA